MKRRTKTSDPPVDGMVTRVAGFGKAVTAKGRRGSGERKQQGVTKCVAVIGSSTRTNRPTAASGTDGGTTQGEKRTARMATQAGQRDRCWGAEEEGYSAGAASNRERERRVNKEGIIVTSPTWHLGQKGVDVNAAHGAHAKPTIIDIEHQLWGCRGEAEAGIGSKGTSAWSMHSPHMLGVARPKNTCQTHLPEKATRLFKDPGVDAPVAGDAAGEDMLVNTQFNHVAQRWASAGAGARKGWQRWDRWDPHTFFFRSG
jgi:hypothetical protein